MAARKQSNHRSHPTASLRDVEELDVEINLLLDNPGLEPRKKASRLKDLRIRRSRLLKAAQLEFML
jgi:hypothetical protein